MPGYFSYKCFNEIHSNQSDDDFMTRTSLVPYEKNYCEAIIILIYVFVLSFFLFLHTHIVNYIYHCLSLLVVPM
jgi:hypothetical protein